ncbi:MAG: class I SAM-dependent methyltransferase [Phycisphaerales bacterium]|nr:class I SAM-dependent methyltransferase [Phycisphaerales bacterium]MCB9836596.1 class I SAM-dependent methyltransferase [Phycisphaera sp.]
MTKKRVAKPWELSPTTRFDDRAELYAKYRPSYPAEAIDCVLEGLGDPAGLLAADIGAGTGIVSRLLAGCGVSVRAVEPNAQMRRVAEQNEHVHWTEGTAEKTGLDDHSVDLIVSGQAWHWFEPNATCKEMSRIAIPGGRLALLWYDDLPGNEPSQEYRRIVEPGAKETFGIHAVEQWEPTLAPPLDHKKCERFEFEYAYRLDLTGLIGRARSASYVPHEGLDADRLVREMTEMHARFAESDGFVTMGLLCIVHRYAL